MPFHAWEGAMPNRALVAMEVFDSISPKYPPLFPWLLVLPQTFFGLALIPQKILVTAL
jgi:hypothetical protein